MKRIYLVMLVSSLLVFTFSAYCETIIIDNLLDAFSASPDASWSTGSYSGFHVTDYRHIETETSETATATWTPSLDTSGDYEVSVWYVAGSNRATDARFTIHHNSGTSVVNVDQTQNGSQWISLGTYTFPASGGKVVLSNQSATAGKAVIADAVRFVREGTTYGDLYQGMWIYSWGTGFLSPSQTQTMMSVARENHLNIIFPEVRKVGDAYYLSDTEPFASNIEAGYTDPLADILEQAHDTSNGKQYIEVHAWIVPYRVWSSNMSGDPPSNHVISEHPEWRGQTEDGSISDYYLDPGVPGVLDYLVDVVTEIVEKYDVDGIHFDYFRYMGTEWGYNPIAIERFNHLYGRTGRPSSSDSDFSDFRRDQIRQLGRKAYAAVKAIRWDCKMSSATIQWGSCPDDFTQSSAYNSIFQDWPGFMAEGCLDMNVLMNYKREHVSDQAYDYRRWVQKLASTKAGRHAINGPGIYMNHIENSVTQILYALDTPDIDGTNPYVYHQTNMDGYSNDLFWDTIRADCFERRNVPAAPWLDQPTQGILRGTVKAEDIVQDGVTVTLSGGASGSIKTDGTGFYAFLKMNPGTGFSATVTVDGFPPLTRHFNIEEGTVTTLDFNLGESHPGMSVY